MNRITKCADWQSLAFLLAVAVAIFTISAAAGADTPFEGEKSTWRDSFARFDYLMDDETLDIQPFKRGADERFGVKDPPPGKHRCVVIVPKQPALGNPWSWRGCYWDHQPQVEVELLKRGFHVAYISANVTLKPGKQWEAWYAFLTEKQGLSKKPAFVGMSRGGEYSYIWATDHPSKVACIYADNPGVNPNVLKKLGDLAAADVPILHVCGSIDPLLGRSAGTIESIYQQYGGRVSVMIQEGKGHHPHSLRDPGPIADFISQSVQPTPSTPPAYLSGRIAKSSFYSLESAYRHFPREGIYITCRGPWFTDCYDRYSFELKGVAGAINVILPRKSAPGKPWTFRADHVGRDATVDLALLARGFHIVTGPVPFNGDGPSLEHWNAVYKLLTEHGFSKKPVLEGAGGAAGEAYAWAIANPDKVSCIYGENPVLRCTMTKAQPLDNLAVLAKAGVPILHVCGSLDPMLQNHTRTAESRCKELGAAMTVTIQEGMGHYPTAPKDPMPVVDFILRQQEPKSAKPKLAAAAKPQTKPADTAATKTLGRSQSGTGQYFQVDYPPSMIEGELAIAVTYTIWVPDRVKQLRGVIVHQHGAGTTASIEGGTAAYDLHWQALAKKWDCALLGPSYHVLHDQNDVSPGGSELWFDPRRGSEKAFLRALGDLANGSAHPELEKAPWILWGHSGGGIWADVLSTLHPERVVAMWLRSGSAAQFRTHPEFVRPQVPPACYTIPIMVNPGVKEEKTFQQNPKGLEKGPWWGNLATFHEYREQGALIGFAADPRTGHECGDSRYLAIPFLDACMALRLPAPGNQDQKLKAMNTSQAWLAPLFGTEVVPAAKYRGDAKESVWLPNEAVARAWLEYVKTGAVSDMTPPPAPTNVRAWPKGAKGELGTEIVWSAEADFESGIGGFIVLRDGQELAKLPQTPVGRFGRPLFQSMTYHDTPAQPLPEMRYLDISAKPDAKHTYEVITVNSVGLKSATSVKAVPYPRVNMSTSYQVDRAWPRRPQSVSWGPMSGVAVDAQDNVWVLSRTDPPVQIYQPDGTFLRAWGEGLLDTPHQLKLDSQGNVWLADSGNHVVLQCTPQGKVIRTLGTPGEPGCDERHFNRPADMVITPEGDVFVADGYGNARVVHFDSNGKFVKSWGKLGTEPGDFSLPHAIALDSRGRLYVADRNNVRIQVFDQNGKFLDQWQNIVVPCAFWMTKDDELWVCGSSPMTWRADDKVLGYPPVDQLFMRFNTSGKLLQLWAAPKGEDGKERPGDLNWAHGMALDSKGNIYAVDIKGQRAQKFVLQGTSSQDAHKPARKPAKRTREQIIEQTMKPFQGTSSKGVDCSTMTGKVLCGYQGWHAAEGDDCGRGWYHWTGRNGFKPGSTNVDLWPDVSELDADERYATAFKTADGKAAEVYSAFNAKTVIRHFKWMQDYGIDGVFVQRFAGEVFNPPGLRQFNTVLDHCREGANKFGRTYAVMYDLSGMRAGQMGKVIEDWKLLVEKMAITKDPAYLHHNGRPVVAVWGFGFSDGRKYTLQEGLELVAFLKSVAGGQCTVLLGVPTYWRTLERDTVNDKTLHELILKADLISPWTVGRFGTSEGAGSYAAKTMVPDIAWCKQHDKEYLPVVFPGFSWHNQNPRFPVNQIARKDGAFLWSQFTAAKKAGATMVYQAMFDEVDEGTAIYKCTNNVPIGASQFLTFEGLPSDHYLKVVGAASKMIRGDAPLSDELPTFLSRKRGADNWDRFRGPNGTGTAHDKDVPLTFGAKDNVVWKVALPGAGNSSPVVWGKHLFLQSASKDGKLRTLICLDTAGGKIIWQRSVPGVPVTIRADSSSASSTPTTDGEAVYVSFWDGRTILVSAYDFQGEKLWSKDLGPFNSQHGAGASPILYKDKLILANDMDKDDFYTKQVNARPSMLVALDKRTGRLVWETPRTAERACYSAPFLLHKPGQSEPELVVTSTTAVTGYNLQTGSKLWEAKGWQDHALKVPMRTVASPALAGDILCVCSGGDAGRFAIGLALPGASTTGAPQHVWENRKDFPYVPSPVARGDYFYFVNDAGLAGCYHARTGKRVWFERLADTGFTASPLVINGKIYAASTAGDVYVFAAEPTFQLLARNELDEGIRATPAVAGGRLYIRGERHLYCVGKRSKEINER